MHQLGYVAVIFYVHDHSLAFLDTQQISRRTAVVSDRLDFLLWRSSSLTGAMRSEKCAGHQPAGS